MIPLLFVIAFRSLGGFFANTLKGLAYDFEFSFNSRGQQIVIKIIIKCLSCNKGLNCTSCDQCILEMLQRIIVHE